MLVKKEDKIEKSGFEPQFPEINELFNDCNYLENEENAYGTKTSQILPYNLDFDEIFVP